MPDVIDVNFRTGFENGYFAGIENVVRKLR